MSFAGIFEDQDVIGEWYVKKLWFGYTIMQCVSQWALGSGYIYSRDSWGNLERFYSRERAQAEADKRNNEKVTHGNQ